LTCKQDVDLYNCYIFASSTKYGRAAAKRRNLRIFGEFFVEIRDYPHCTSIALFRYFERRQFKPSTLAGTNSRRAREQGW